MIIRAMQHADTQTGKPVFDVQAVEPGGTVVLGARGETLKQAYWRMRDYVETACKERKIT